MEALLEEVDCPVEKKDDCWFPLIIILSLRGILTNQNFRLTLRRA